MRIVRFAGAAYVCGVLSRNIVVATDFSEASIPALVAAADLLRQQGGAATLVHVLSLPDLDGRLEQPRGADADLEVAVHEHLDRLREEHFATIAGVKTALLREASAAEALCDFAKSQDASLIVIGTQGRSGLARFLIGSVAERVVRHAPCPVLVLR